MRRPAGAGSPSPAWRLLPSTPHRFPWPSLLFGRHFPTDAGLKASETGVAGGCLSLLSQPYLPGLHPGSAHANCLTLARDLTFFSFDHAVHHEGSHFPDQGSNWHVLHWKYSLNHWAAGKGLDVTVSPL